MFKYDFKTRDSGEGKKRYHIRHMWKLYHDPFKIMAESVIFRSSAPLIEPEHAVALPFGIIIYLLRVFDNDDKYVIKEILGKSDYHEGNSACRRLWNQHYPITKAVPKQLLHYSTSQ